MKKGTCAATVGPATFPAARGSRSFCCEPARVDLPRLAAARVIINGAALPAVEGPMAGGGATAAREQRTALSCRVLECREKKEKKKRRRRRRRRRCWWEKRRSRHASARPPNDDSGRTCARFSRAFLPVRLRLT